MKFWAEFNRALSLAKQQNFEDFAEILAALEVEALKEQPAGSERVRLIQRARAIYAGKGSGSPVRSEQVIEKWPRITVITPTFNQGRFIDETIRSIKDQRYPNLQYVVVDGASTDETSRVVTGHGSFVNVFISEKDGGQSDAINKGMALADGELLTWINSDDLLAPDALHTVAAEYRLTRFDLLIGVCRVFSEQRDRFVNWHTCNVPHGLSISDLTDLERKWLRGYFFHQPEVFFSRRLWSAAGARVRTDLHYSMDYELWARFSLHAPKIVKSAAVVAEFRTHPGQKTVGPEAYVPELREVAAGLRRDVYLAAAPMSPMESSGTGTARSRLRIAGVSDFGLNGGAGIAHHQILRTLAAAGHEVVQLSCFNTWQTETDPYDPAVLYQLLADLQPDIVVTGNLHNVSCGLDILESVAQRFPTIFVMHDMWIVSGRCAYAEGCLGYLTQCLSTCPTLDKYPRLVPGVAIEQAHQRKLRLIEGSKNLHILANSSWTLDRLRPVASTAIAQHRARKLTLPIDTSVFYPRDKQQARARFGIEADATVVLLGAAYLNDPRKGFDIISDAAPAVRAAVKGLKLHYVFFGAEVPEAIASSFGAHLSLGHIRSREEMAELFSSADIFLGASREETFGQTYAEAMACGVPVVSLRVGGIEDIVVNAITGYLVDPVFAREGLVGAIKILAADERARSEMSRNAVLLARSRFSFMATLRDIYELLEASGLAHKLRFIPAVNSFKEALSPISIPEIVCNDANIRSDAPRRPRKKAAIKLTCDELAIFGGYPPETSDGIRVTWLGRKSVICIPLDSDVHLSRVVFHIRHVPSGMDAVRPRIRMKGRLCEDVKFHQGTLTLSVPETLERVGFLPVSLEFDSASLLEDGREVSWLLAGAEIHG